MPAVALKRAPPITFVLALITAAGSAQSSSLERVGVVPVEAAALGVSADRLVAAQGSSVQVVDLADPTTPRLLGRHDFEEPAFDLVIAPDGGAAYVANSHDGLRRLDLSDPSAPAVTATSPTRGQAVGVAAAGPHLFVGDNSLGFDIVGGAGAGELARVGEYLGDGFPRGIAAGGSLVFVADQPMGLVVVDVSDPAAPEAVGVLSLGRDPVGRVVAPDGRSLGGAAPAVVAIVSGRAGMQLVDVSDPAAPRVTAPVPVGGSAAGAAIWGERLYVASGETLEVFDVGDPEAPTRVASAALGGRGGALAVDEDHVFVAVEGNIVIYGR
ncbi:MAG: hypothetical protein F4W89_06495 [Acidobacteria bacterium]|nr:hypothetical protein [Acidobacteriota bacterium]